MEQEYIVPACSGIAIPVLEGKLITVTDLEGSQVVDFLRRS